MAQQLNLKDITIKSFTDMNNFLNKLLEEDSDNIPVPNPEEANVEEAGYDEGIVWDTADDTSEVPVYGTHMHAMQFRQQYLRELIFCTTISYVSIHTKNDGQIPLCMNCYLWYASKTPLATHRHMDAHYARTYWPNGDRCKTCRARLYQQRPVEACIICNDANKLME